LIKAKKTDKVWFYRMDMPDGYKHFSKTRPMLLEHFDKCLAWWKKRAEIKDEETDTYKAKAYSVKELAESNYDLDLCGFPTVEEEVLSPEETIKDFHTKRDALNAKIDKRLAELEKMLGVES
jgi:type I restriction enzyme M protein